MVDQLNKAAIDISKLLHKCETDGDNFDTTLSKISNVKVHGVVLPTLMLMEIIDSFSLKREERERARFNPETSEQELQAKYGAASKRWNNGH